MQLTHYPRLRALQRAWHPGDAEVQQAVQTIFLAYTRQQAAELSLMSTSYGLTATDFMEAAQDVLPETILEFLTNRSMPHEEARDAVRAQDSIHRAMTKAINLRERKLGVLINAAFAAKNIHEDNIPDDAKLPPQELTTALLTCVEKLPADERSLLETNFANARAQTLGEIKASLSPPGHRSAYSMDVAYAANKAFRSFFNRPMAAEAVEGFFADLGL